MSSEIKYQDFVLSKIGWGVAIIFSLFGYVSYYLWIYPALASVPLRQNVYSKAPIVSPAFEDLGIQISAPLYLSNFQGSLLTITIVNDSVNQIIEGKLNLNITGSNLLVDENRIEKYVLTFLLKPKEVFTKNFTVKVLDNEDTHVIFTTNLSQLVVYDYVRNDFLSVATPTLQVDMGYTVTPEYLITPNVTSTLTVTATPQISETFDQDERSGTQTWIGDYPVEWIMDGYEWQGGKCKDETNAQDSLKTEICAINYPYGSFAESSLSKLLLPPWSGLSSLAMVFGAVWLLEQFMLNYGTVKIETLQSKQIWWYALILFIFSGILLVNFSFGILFVFTKINYSPLVYYGVLIGLIAFALVVGQLSLSVFTMIKNLSEKYVQVGGSNFRIDTKNDDISTAFVISSVLFVIFTLVLIKINNLHWGYYVGIAGFALMLLFVSFLQSRHASKNWEQAKAPSMSSAIAEKSEVDKAEDEKIRTEKVEIDKASSRHDLIEIRRIMNSTKNENIRSYAKTKDEEVHSFLQLRVNDWGTDIKEGKYGVVARLVENAIPSASSLSAIPDQFQILRPVLIGKEGVELSQGKEWIFNAPDQARQFIIQALKDKDNTRPNIETEKE